MSAKQLNKFTDQYAFLDYERHAVQESLGQAIQADPRKIIVLDDDPTGVQTVHDVYIYTDFSVDNICEGLRGSEKLFYILTNSRGLTEAETTMLHQELARNIAEASRITGKSFMIISRGDSTLRGHFPLETQVLKETLQACKMSKPDGEILFPFFKEGGRYTVDNIHYVADGNQLTPAGETEFARDKTFGYQASDLRGYIDEKTRGAYPADQVTAISLTDLRAGRIVEIYQQLIAVTGFGKVIVNALDECDVEVFCLALYQAMAAGKEFMFRTAASFVKVIGGISTQPLLNRAAMVCTKNVHGGVVVVGSHTQKTTRQLEGLRQLPNLEFIEFNSDLVLTGELKDEVMRVVRLIEKAISTGKTAVAYTRRTLLTTAGDTKENALKRSVAISEAVQNLIGMLNIVPSFIIAKGGITSSDIGVKALKVKKAKVLGQIRPGIPVWQTGKESRFPGIPYVIFPGNVGSDETLKEAVEILVEAR